MQGQFMENPVLKSNFLMETLMQLTILCILENAFIQLEVVSLPLLRDTALHGENLENFHPCLLEAQFL